MEQVLERLTQLEANIATTVKDEVSRAVAASREGFTEEAAAACSAHLDELSAKAAKIARKSLPVTFSKPEHRHVYEKARDTVETMEEAERHLTKNNIDRALESLKTGKTVLNTLMKHVKLADREELGWSVVKHYDSDDLLSGSDDEKALGRARRIAAAEAKKTVPATPTSKSANPSSAQTTSRPPPSLRQDSSGSRRGRSTAAPSNTRPRSRSPRGREYYCYICCHYGHTARYCRTR